jgi:hypothetical protein
MGWFDMKSNSLSFLDGTAGAARPNPPLADVVKPEVATELSDDLL